MNLTRDFLASSDALRESARLKAFSAVTVLTDVTHRTSGPRLSWLTGGYKRALATASRRNAPAKRGPAANSSTHRPRPQGAHQTTFSNAAATSCEAMTPLKENPYPYLHSRHNHRPNSCFQPVFGGCEADFVRDGSAVYTRVLAGPCELRNRGSVGLGRTAPAERRTVVRGRRRIRRVHLARLGLERRRSSSLPARLPRPATRPGPRGAIRARTPRQLGLSSCPSVDLLAAGTVT